MNLKQSCIDFSRMHGNFCEPKAYFFELLISKYWGNVGDFGWVQGE